jgi:hypothetical protein
MESGPAPGGNVAERLDHLGIVAGVCRHALAWAGLQSSAALLGAAALCAKAVERLLGPGITAEDLKGDCLGRALDWRVRARSDDPVCWHRAARTAGV